MMSKARPGRSYHHEMRGIGSPALVEHPIKFTLVLEPVLGWKPLIHTVATQ